VFAFLETVGQYASLVFLGVVRSCNVLLVAQ